MTYSAVIHPPARSSRKKGGTSRVTDAVTIETETFRFTSAFSGLETIAQAGTVIAYDGARPVVTPYDDCVLIMPTKRLKPGQTAVRLGRYIPG